MRNSAPSGRKPVIFWRDEKRELTVRKMLKELRDQNEPSESECIYFARCNCVCVCVWLPFAMRAHWQHSPMLSLRVPWVRVTKQGNMSWQWESHRPTDPSWRKEIVWGYQSGDQRKILKKSSHSFHSSHVLVMRGHCCITFMHLLFGLKCRRAEYFGSFPFVGLPVAISGHEISNAEFFYGPAEFPLENLSWWKLFNELCRANRCHAILIGCNRCMWM